MTRYEIREIDLGASLPRPFNPANRRYVVWDTEKDRRVPFGIYLTREDAEERIARGLRESH